MTKLPSIEDIHLTRLATASALERLTRTFSDSIHPLTSVLTALATTIAYPKRCPRKLKKQLKKNNQLQQWYADQQQTNLNRFLQEFEKNLQPYAD